MPNSVPMRLLNAFAGFCLLLSTAATTTVTAQCPPDTDAPVITDMPSPITGTADAGMCGTTVSWDIPTATDNCEVTFFGADQVPGDFYAVGITTVTYTAMDAEGNMSAASFTITISDDENPAIADMPANISLSNDLGICGAVATWTEPTASDNCGIASLTSTHDSGDTFAVGTTTVTYTATDVNGNSITDSFDITVTDNEAPSAAANDLTLVLDASGAASTTSAAVNNGSSDNCSIASIDLSQTDFDCTHLGSNTVTLTVTDIHSNQSTATATITVQDNQSPVIAQMADISATNDANNCSAVVTWTDPAVTDNCTYTLTPDIASGATFNVGVTTVTYSVTDAGGNTDSMSFDVTVTDTQAPTISGMPATDITQGTDAGVCTAAVTWSAPTASDNCTTDAVGNPANVTLTSTHQPGSDFAIGTTTVTYTAIDIYGNTSTASFNVIVTSTDTDGDGICDTGDNCSDTDACNYADPANVACATPVDCDTCSDATGTGTIVDNDADDDGVCDADEIAGCQDNTACNYNSAATDSDGSCTYTADPCDTCSGATDGSGTVVDNDADDDGVCNDDEIAGCQDNTACNYNSAATDSDGSCSYTVDPCDTCSGETDGTGTVVDNDADDDGVCDANEIVGCQNNTACNYNADATDLGVCLYTDGVCETCSGETRRTGIVVDNDADGDYVCDVDEITGCQDNTACNYNSAATDAGSCIYTDGICETCSGETDGTGTVVDNDADDDSVCDGDEIVGCQDNTACNYNAAATDAGTCTYVDGICETCVAGAIVDNDADDDGVCDADEIAGCQDNTACNYNAAATDSDGSCTYTDGICETCVGGAIVDNDADDDGVCDADEVAGCQDNTACNYNSAATDSDGSCVFTADPCDTCSGATDGTGTVIDNDSDNDGVCDADEIVGCQDNTACNYNASATDAGACTYVDGICETCESGIIVDNDSDNDGVCDADEIYGCQDNTACNYNAAATDSDGSCTYVDGICETCVGGAIVDNDSDDDGVCDADEIAGCQDNTACNYNSAATDSDGSCTYTVDPCDTCSGATDGSGTVVDNDADDDGVCDDDEIAGCQDNTACNYNVAATDSDGSCTFTSDPCDTCSGATDGSGTVVDNDADDDGVCDDDEIAGCQDNTACNYNAAATDSDGSCTYTDGICETCVAGSIIDNDDDDDGVCNANEVTGCTDATACNYNAAATDPPSSDVGWTLVLRSDLSTAGLGEFSSGNQVGTEDGTGDYRVGLTGAQMASMDLTQIRVTTASGYEVIFEGPFDANAFDNVCSSCNCQGNALATDLYWSGGDGGCYGSSHFGFSRDGNIHVQCGTAGGTQDQHWGHFHRGGVNTGVYTFGDDCINEVEWSETFFIYGAFGYYDQTCAYTDDVCETCSGETDGSGSVVDNDADDDGICDADEIVGCQDATACNYNSDATDAGVCTFAAGCDTCSGETDGSGTVVNNDADNDGTCDSADGCPNDPAKTDPGICGCGNVDTDVDSDGVCDDNDLCTDPLANNYLSPGGEECEVCPDAPIFNGISPLTPATTMSSADGAISLDLSGNTATTLYLMGINGAPDYTISLPDALNNLQAGYYTAMVQDADGCWGVAGTSPGGTTLQQPAVSLELIIPFDLCCSGCGINDSDADGICDDDDNCTDQTATNFADPANSPCSY